MSEPKKFLIIDDEPSLLLIMGKFLKKLGYDSDTANNGKDGIQLCQNNQEGYYGLFIDYNLPDLPSAEIILRIKKKNPNIKIILSTGFEVDDVLKKFKDMNIEINNTLQKPYTFEDFKNLIETI